MIKIKVIKTERDYEEALKLVEDLMSRDPDPDSEKGEQLSLLSSLIQDYETRVFSESLPDPIEAIKFRIEQAGLTPGDLVPYIGSRSRVSEILSGKRQLTLEMVRALEAGLGIPAKVLIRKPDPRKCIVCKQELKTETRHTIDTLCWVICKNTVCGMYNKYKLISKKEVNIK